MTSMIAPARTIMPMPALTAITVTLDVFGRGRTLAGLRRSGPDTGTGTAAGVAGMGLSGTAVGNISPAAVLRALAAGDPYPPRAGVAVGPVGASGAMGFG